MGHRRGAMLKSVLPLLVAMGAALAVPSAQKGPAVNEGDMATALHMLKTSLGMPTRSAAADPDGTLPAVLSNVEPVGSMGPKSDDNDKDCGGCSGHGACVKGQCVCEAGWSYYDCSIKACPNGCKDADGELRGQCMNGKCLCNPGFSGDDCSQPGCPNDCSDKGECKDGACVCKTGWSGVDCSAPACPFMCSGHGACQKATGTCKCEERWGGSGCEALLCPNNCTGANGKCLNGVCMCCKEFRGADCSVRTCSDNDMDIQGKCFCEDGWHGDNCEIRTCPRNCLGRGNCVSGVCFCNPGWKGEDCSAPACKNDCGGPKRGVCVKSGQCYCMSGWEGPSCLSRSCPNDCSGHGVCNNGTCVCEGKFAGSRCDQVACLKVNGVQCAGNGQCVKGKCICKLGFYGLCCDHIDCPEDCNDNGNCTASGVCECEPAFMGQSCARRHCNGHGVSVLDKSFKAVCQCDTDYIGDNCETKNCPKNCSGHGLCDQPSAKCMCDAFWNVNNKTCEDLDCSDRGFPDKMKPGVCSCDPETGYTGAHCEMLECNHGRLMSDNATCECEETWQNLNGSTLPLTPKVMPCAARQCGPYGTFDRNDPSKCICKTGWTGELCNSRTCQQDCNNNGICNNGTCTCSAGWTGNLCSIRFCPDECSGNGLCQDGKCICKEGWDGANCAIKLCPGKNHGCNGHGDCNSNTECSCYFGWTGDDCSFRECANNCSSHGKCVDGECKCNKGWAGDSCNVKTCKETCSNHGRCNVSSGKCVCDATYYGPRCTWRRCLNSCSGMAFAHVTLSASVAKDGPGQAVSNAHVVERVNMDAMDMASASLWLVAVITPLCNAIVTKIGKVFTAPTTSARIVAVDMVHAGTGTATASQVTQVKTAVKVIARAQAL